MLSTFSEHIMANSLLNLFKGNNSLVEKMNNAIEAIKINDKAKPILSKLENIQKHLSLYIELKGKKTYIQLFELAKIVNKKGYFLNAITLLDEAIGWYCADSICTYSKDFKTKYDRYIKYDSYKITSNAKNIIKFTFLSRKYNNVDLELKDIDDIQKSIDNIDGSNKFTYDLLKKVGNIRNNLAHANSRDKLNEIRKKLEKLFARFNTYCIEKDILKKRDASFEDLMKKFNS